MTEKAYYVTTPIYYVNDAPHIGHAYTTVAGDVLTRWHRQKGQPTWYLTGTDEHGQKVMRTADANGVAPQAWVDKLVEEAWLPNWKALNIANDDFIRTTSERHTTRVQKFLQKLKDAGHIYAGKFEGPYCVGCEEFKLPGDLLEENGQKVCPIHGKPVEIVDEDNWFFKLSDFKEALLKRYKENPSACEPESARNEVISFLEGEVRDLSISRSTFSWGIPVPWDTKQVVYVWFDALLNYATAVGLGDDIETEGGKKFAETWPVDVHLVGKDILRFHAVIWPAMLMAAGLPIPEKVFAHGWLLVGGEKMSKSKLTGIAPSDITSHFGVDAFRYYFMRAIPFGSDGSFSWEDMAARYTSELANDFGNLASRLTAMIEKYCDGAIPAPTDPLRHAQRQPQQRHAMLHSPRPACPPPRVTTRAAARARADCDGRDPHAPRPIPARQTAHRRRTPPAPQARAAASFAMPREHQLAQRVRLGERDRQAQRIDFAHRHHQTQRTDEAERL